MLQFWYRDGVAPMEMAVLCQIKVLQIQHHLDLLDVPLLRRLRVVFIIIIHGGIGWFFVVSATP
jgi:hypothetical protein